MVAHDLDFMSILHEIEEYQFAPSKPIGTYPTYWPKYMRVKIKQQGPTMNDDSVLYSLLVFQTGVLRAEFQAAQRGLGI
mgnify:CR=1 FL=1